MAIENIDLDTCIGCGKCMTACSVDVIRMNPETKKPYLKYPQDCMLCNLCVYYCPVDAIFVGADTRDPLFMNCG
jgi:NAD-dependent dihydropyrimidine dehydrogenase PreA subunit